MNWTSCSCAGSSSAGRRLLTRKEVFSDGSWTARTIGSGNGAWGCRAPTIRSLPPLSRRSREAIPAHCLLDWRPSALLSAALILLGAMTATACLLSAAPVPLARVGAAAAGLEALRLARREGRRPARSLQFAVDGRSVRISADRTGLHLRLDQLAIHVRGPVASLQGRDSAGRRHSLVWWPDTLGEDRRRVLQIAAGAGIPETGSTLATIQG